MKAFILGAGLGTRLRPLTDQLPKPLVPLFHRPLIDWAMEACQAAGATDFAINTHHLPKAWDQFASPAMFPFTPWVGTNGVPAIAKTWRGHPLALFHEPTLLETGGGLKNLAPWISERNGPVLVHNGDIFSTLPLRQLVEAHIRSGLVATLVLRSDDGLRNVEVNPSANRVLDLRGCLGVGAGSHAFTGIYCIQPDFLKLIQGDGPESIIPAFLELASHAQLGALVLNDGIWLDLGDPHSYLEAHRTLNLAAKIHPSASIPPSAEIVDSVIGPGASIGERSILKRCVVWPNCRVPADSTLQDEILTTSLRP